MSNELPNTSLFFDNSKKKDMQSFLDRIYTIAIQNPNVNINKGLVYNQLRYGLLPEKEKNHIGEGVNNRQFFSRWEDEFMHVSNIDAFCDYRFHYWFLFTNDLEGQSDYIKIYVPINAPHLYKSVAELFEFIANENIVHASKVAEEARLDNVIIRIAKDDTKALNRILNFINSNKYIRTGLNKNNPFVPTINGIGVMNEHGNSYNSDLSLHISNYINDCLKRGAKPNIEEFRNYVITYSDDNDLTETFENAYHGRNRFISKGEKKKEKTGLSLEQKTYLLIDALKATYMRYGLIQVETALYHAVNNNDYSYFTNAGELALRDKLKKNVSKEDIMQIVKYALPNFVKQEQMPRENNKKLAKFVEVLFQNEAVMSLDEACLATLEKYGQASLVSAIYKFLTYNDSTGFTRQGNTLRKVNYRDQIIRIGKEKLLEYLKKSIQLRGFEMEDIPRNIVQTYVEVLNNSRYTTLNDSPIISR